MSLFVNCLVTLITGDGFTVYNCPRYIEKAVGQFYGDFKQIS